MVDYIAPSEESSDGPSPDDFRRRFDGYGLLGVDIWRGWLERGRWRRVDDEGDAGDDGGALDELIGLLAQERQRRTLKCPRVFVSHRHADAAYAMRVAWLANKAGFEFWLDVLDPNLQLAAAGAPSRAQSALVASIIELALLNSSHVIAVLSKDTRGTLWVPYEYGRVKSRRIHSKRAAVWLHPNVATADIPEYTVLGVTARSESRVERWFADELLEWCKTKQRCCNGAGNKWSGRGTVQLPDKQ